MLKIGIIQPDSVYRSALKRYCLLHENIRCLFAENSVQDLTHKSFKQNPDVLLIEITPDSVLTEELISKINKQFHNPVIVVLGSEVSNTSIIEFIGWGVKGYILKKENPVSVIDKIKDIEQGGLPFSSEVLYGVINYFKKSYPK